MTKIEEYRRKAGMTQEELAKASGISREHISAIENEKYEPNIKTYKKFAKAFNCELKDLL